MNRLVAESAGRWRPRGWTNLYSRARRSRSLAALLLLLATAKWFTSKIPSYTDLVQNKRQQVMGGFGALLSATTAPIRYFPWYSDLAAGAQYDNAGDVFRDYRPFIKPNFTPSGLVRTEKGILVALRLVCKYFFAPVSAGTLVSIQLALDLLALYGLSFLLWRWGGPLVAFGGTLYYASAVSVANAVTFPFYYYWPIPFGVLLCLVADWAARRGRTGRVSPAIALGFCAGLWLLFRATSTLIPLAIAAALLAARVPFRRVLPAMIIVIFLQQLPALVVAARAPKDEPGGLGRSNIWHSIYIGIGTRPNPYGIVFNDSYAMEMVWNRYRVGFQAPGYEKALRREYMKILYENPMLILRNTALNFVDAVRGWSFAKDSVARGRWLWIGALLGLGVVIGRKSDKTFPFVLATGLWMVQCATLAFVCRPQESYLWETLAIAALAGYGGLGIALEWTLERLGMKVSPESSDHGEPAVIAGEPPL